MATYEEWNQTLLDYCIAGLPRGSRVYITVDDDTLAYVATTLQTSTNEFAALLRRRCILSNEVALNRIRPRQPINYELTPPYFTFLCAMVLAANQMGDHEDEGIDGNAYFHYFNAILDLPTATGRPPGMEGGVEVEFWQDWSVWLQYHGYQPTAVAESHQHYRYALSQALVRPIDRKRLWRYFSDESQRFPDDLHGDDLIQILRAEIRRDEFLLTRHLRRLLNSDGTLGASRYDDLAEMLEETFIAWVENNRSSDFTKATHRVRRSTLSAGLRRSVDPISQEISYYLLPKQPRHEQVSDLSVVYRGEEVPLVVERPGWYEALPWPLSPTDLGADVSAVIKGHSQLRQLALPARNFWVLPLDPDDALSGVYATWQDHPELGVPFVLLARTELNSDLDLLRSKGLLEWQPDLPRTLGSGWVEYNGVMVTGDDWSEVGVTHRDLISALRPRIHFGISLQGGLRDAQSGSWIIRYGPQLIVNAFHDDINVEVFALGEEKPLWMLSNMKAGSPVALGISQPGAYILRVTVESQVRERLVRVIDWEALSLRMTGHAPPIKLQRVQLFGARLLET